MGILSTLTATQLVTVYNGYADKKVKRFESAAIGARRVAALLEARGLPQRLAAEQAGVIEPLPPAPVCEAAKAPGRARAAIIATASKPEGATAVELYAASGWKKCSWNHHLKIAAQQSGRVAEVRKVSGVTRYFLIAPTR